MSRKGSLQSLSDPNIFLKEVSIIPTFRTFIEIMKKKLDRLVKICYTPYRPWQKHLSFRKCFIRSISFFSIITIKHSNQNPIYIPVTKPLKIEFLNIDEMSLKAKMKLNSLTQS